MDRDNKIIAGYRRKQADLRRQIILLKSGKMGAGGKAIGIGTSAAIQRTERQITDLDRAIVRCREKGPT
jgi:hypothetical protein